MLTDWTHWLSSLSTDQVFWSLLPLMLFDCPRYALGSLLVWLQDCVSDAVAWLIAQRRESRFQHCPSVCVVVAGLNEADTLAHTLASVWNSYPRMEIIVVDDGSTDSMARVAMEFAHGHAGVCVLTRPRRGGKSSALNFALPFTDAELIVCVDSDSHLGPNAIWEVVQPFADPEVGAASASVRARNADNNLLTGLQALEYMRSILLGRMLSSRLQTLGIVSGAFGAYRREALLRTGGWDVGPGEDGDLTLRLRKSGYRVAFAPYAQCFTNVPTEVKRLIKQRRRWEWAVVTFECRKHVDLGNPFNKSFRLSNLIMLLDRWTFNLALQFACWIYLAWTVFHADEHTWKIFFLYYVVFLAIEFLQWGIFLYYSVDYRRDVRVGLLAPLMPLYHFGMRLVMFIGVLEELFFRRSYRDNFVPPHVRESTWHW